MRMALNIMLETIVGAIPLVGDLFDVYWKSNQRNVELLRPTPGGPSGRSAAYREATGGSSWGYLVVDGLMMGAAVAAYWILGWILTTIRRAAA